MIDCMCKQNFSFDSQRTKITLSHLSFHLLFCKLFDEKLMNNNNLLSTQCIPRQAGSYVVVRKICKNWVKVDGG